MQNGIFENGNDEQSIQPCKLFVNTDIVCLSVAPSDYSLESIKNAMGGTDKPRIKGADEKVRYDGDEDFPRNRFSVRYRALDDPPEYMTLAKEWLAACTRLHDGSCTPKATEAGTKRPQWVIDTEQQCIVPGEQVNRYLALSYTWAESGNHATTAKPTTMLLNNRNLSAFTTPGFFARADVASQIPFVIQHAVRVVGWLGERYLWVDRVCIVQDDAETLSQVSRMDHVYAGAHLTIIAAAESCMYRRAVDPAWMPCVTHDGFALDEASGDGNFGAEEGIVRAKYCSYCSKQWSFYDRTDENDDDEFESDDAGEALYEECESDDASETLCEESESDDASEYEDSSEDPLDISDDAGEALYGESGSDDDFECEDSSEDMSDDHIVQTYNEELLRSKWGCRGWTYQEQILCARAIVFTNRSVFFDCQKSLWDNVSTWPGQDDSLARRREKLAQRFHRPWPDFQFYMDLICPYNGRLFTYPQDALLGISGILNAIAPSFAGGFISGLPSLFLDHALLWQPFGVGSRRMDVVSADEKQGKVPPAVSSLPSWAWCGWCCYVDPWSLLSGLAYMSAGEEKVRGRSWRTKKLVDWYVSNDPNANVISSRPVEEARIFDLWANKKSAVDSPLLSGWSESISTQDTSSELETKYFHETDPLRFFNHPVLISNKSNPRPCVSTESYLLGSTQTAIFHPAAVLRYKLGLPTDGGHKLTAFEHPIFTAGSPDADCSVLVLQSASGRFAGLMRLMDQSPVKEPDGLELVAISRGSASGPDLRKSYEWTAFETREWSYFPRGSGRAVFFDEESVSETGRIALSTNLAEVFMGGQVDDWETFSNVLREELSSVSRKRAVKEDPGGRWRAKLLRKQEREKKGSYSLGDGDLCEFYNVLWVERNGGIVYRRACGWVSKVMWEAHSLGPVEIKLG